MIGLRRAPRRTADAPPAGRSRKRRARVAGSASRPRSEAAVTDGDEDPPGVAARRIPVHRRIPIAVLVAVTVVATALAGWSAVTAYGLRTGAAANQALADVATTQAVTDAVRQAVESAFSYDYANIDRTREAAREVLVGRAVQQYDELYAQVEQQATARRLVLTTAVRSIGVTELRGDHAVLLVFVDQQIVQTGGGEHKSGASQMSVAVVQSNGSWLVEDITVL